MRVENLAFDFGGSFEAGVSFKIELDSAAKLIHERALGRAQRYLVAEADLLLSIIEIDKNKIYEKFKETYLTPYCIKFLGLTEGVAENFVRVARRSALVPELNQAVQDGRLSVTKAK